MKIAIQAADLDSHRIDGTRVYILNLLKNFGKLDQSSRFLIYHKKNFNQELQPPEFPNYKIIQKNSFYIWTQTRFALEIWKDKPDVLWMPMQALTVLRRKDLKTVITVHDLAFKIFPGQFLKSDLRRLNFYADYAIKNSSKIIAVSESTKRDILKFYPKIREDKIKVIYHGFDESVFSKRYSDCEIADVLEKYNIIDKNQKSKINPPAGEAGNQNDNVKCKINYLLYVGALQPRKNLILLVKAFEELKKKSNYDDLKLVLVGKPAWMADKILERIGKSEFAADIILTGQISFQDIYKIFQGAGVFVFPSLYEGFGIPILEAFASQMPVICANNSSLPEVAGDAALYFEDNNFQELANKIEKLLGSEELKKDLVVKGFLQLKNFSWEKCAEETLEYIKN
jgi:glycosyltransferase involved in cell wall biosynthesis